MQKSPPALDPDAYLASLGGWQRLYVQALRAETLAAAPLAETVKWGHLVYHANGPVLLIRPEPQRVLFGFWRGQRLRAIEPRLKSGGKYEMATLELHEDTPLERAVVGRLVREAVALNGALGDPTEKVGRLSQAGELPALRATGPQQPSRNGHGWQCMPAGAVAAPRAAEQVCPCRA